MRIVVGEIEVRAEEIAPPQFAVALINTRLSRLDRRLIEENTRSDRLSMLTRFTLEEPEKSEFLLASSTTRQESLPVGIESDKDVPPVESILVVSPRELRAGIAAVKHR